MSSTQFSGDLKCDHVKSGVLRIKFQIVHFDGLGYNYRFSYGPYHLKTKPFKISKIRTFLPGFQMGFEKITTICPN